MIDALQERLVRFLQRVVKRPRIDIPLALGLMTLATVGLVTLYSASGGNIPMIGGQAARFAMGGVLVLLISRIPPSVLRTWTPWLYAGSVFLLLVVAAIGEVRSGSKRWLDLGVLSFNRRNCSNSPCL